MENSEFANQGHGQSVLKMEPLDAEEVKACISKKRERSFGSDPFSEDEERCIRRKLDVGLSRNETMQRPGPGGTRLTYIEGWKVIHDANQIFGFNGWSSQVMQLDMRFLDERNGRFNACVCATVRITLRDGAFREDRGGGSADNMRSKGDAVLKAEKEAVTDATKRALKNFGLRLGLSLYDRQHVREMNRPQPKAPAANIHRPVQSGAQTPMPNRPAPGGGNNLRQGTGMSPGTPSTTARSHRQHSTVNSPINGSSEQNGGHFAAQREQAIQRKQAFLRAKAAQEKANKSTLPATNALRAQQGVSMGVAGARPLGGAVQRPTSGSGGLSHELGIPGKCQHSGSRTGSTGLQRSSPASATNTEPGNTGYQGSGSSSGNAANNLEAMRQEEIDELSRMALADF